MSKKDHFDGPNVVGKHTTCSDSASEVMKAILRYCPDMRFKLSYIKRGARSSGNPHIKIRESANGLHLRIAGRGSVQHIYLVDIAEHCDRQVIVGLLIETFGTESVTWHSLEYQEWVRLGLAKA